MSQSNEDSSTVMDMSTLSGALRESQGTLIKHPSKASGKDLELYFSSPVITIFVGAKSKPLYAHRNLLMDRSPYFAAAFKHATFKESITQVLKFPKEDCSAMCLMLRWLYGGPGSLRVMTVSPDQVPRFLKLYIAADKFCMEELKNETIDVVRSTSLKYGSLCAPAAYMIFENTMPRDGMRVWLARQYAWDYRKFTGTRATKESSDEGYNELLDYIGEGGDFAIDVFKAMMERQGTPGSYKGNPAAEDDCTYHGHRDTQKCEKWSGVQTGYGFMDS